MKEKLYIPKEMQYAFAVTLLWTYLIHSYLFYNYIPNADSVSYSLHNTFNWDMTSGRWFLQYFVLIRDGLRLPGIIALGISLFLALSAAFLTDLFKIKSKVSIALLGGIIVSFPTVSGTLIYYYIADAYMLSYFLSILAVYLMVHKNKNYKILAVLCIVISLAIYQAYIGVTITLLFFLGLRALLENKKSIKQILSNYLSYFILVFIGVIIYTLSNKLLGHLYGRTLSGYYGLGNSAIYFLKGVPAKIAYSYKLTWSFFFSNNEVLINDIYRRLLFISILGIVLYIIIANARKIKNKILCILGLILLPLPINVLVFLMDGRIKMRMLPTYAICLIVCVLISEKSPKRYVRGAFVALMALLVLDYTVLSQTVYGNVESNYKKAYGVASRVLNRIEIQEEYVPNKMIFLVKGGMEESEYNFAIANEEFSEKVAGVTSADYEVVYKDNSGSWCNFFQDNFGVKFIRASEDLLELYQEEINNMDVWPKEGAVKIIDNVIILKLSE